MQFDASDIFILALSALFFGVIAWGAIHSRRHPAPQNDTPDTITESPDKTPPPATKRGRRRR